MPQDRYQTVQEIAERLEVAEATVRHWIKLGELRAIDIGKGWRVANVDFERFLKSRETAPREKDRGRDWGPSASAGTVRPVGSRKAPRSLSSTCLMPPTCEGGSCGHISEVRYVR